MISSSTLNRMFPSSSTTVVRRVIPKLECKVGKLWCSSSSSTAKKFNSTTPGKLLLRRQEGTTTTAFTANATNSASRRTMSSSGGSKKPPLTPEEHNEAIDKANKAMQGYVQTRILAKQGKLPSKRKARDGETISSKQHAIQMALLVSMGLAFIASPFLGKKIAKDEEFRNKYIPTWFDFTVKHPPKSSQYTRQEMHNQMVALDEELHERAQRGEFAPENLRKLRRKLEHPLARELSDSDVAMAEKYGWNKIHPGLGEDEDEDDGE